MKTPKLLRALCVVAVFGLTYLGFSASQTTQKIAGEEFVVYSLSFGSNALATCEGPGGPGKGKCTFAGRCGNVYPGETSDCDTDDL